MFSEYPRAATTMMFAAVTLGLCLACDPAFAQQDRAQRDALQVLPDPKSLEGLTGVVIRGRTAGAELQGTREADDMVLRVTVFIGSQVAEAKRIVNGLVTPLPMAARSWTGRRVGDQVLISSYAGGGPPRGAFTLITRCGRAAVCVDLLHKITPGAGAPVQSVFSDADLSWAEDIAIGCVEKLKKLGYGDAQEKQTQSRTKGKKKSKGT